MRAPRTLVLLLILMSGATSAQEFGPQPAAPDLEFDCLLEPRRQVVLSAPVVGVVADVLVERGDSVEKGQLVATLESEMEKATVAMARARQQADAELRGSEARLEFESRRMDRHGKLRTEGVVSDGVYDEIESARLMAEASVRKATEDRELADLELQRAEAALAQRELRSTVKGVVMEVIRQPGEYADPPQILEVAQVDPLRVEVFAPVSALGRISVGATGIVMPEAPVGGEYPATVTVVDPVVDAASGTFGVRLELPNPDHALSAGLKCRVRF
jgi:RND family efflux transporter MFP subunit